MSILLSEPDCNTARIRTQKYDDDDDDDDIDNEREVKRNENIEKYK
jgi:hypothetical protein